VNSVGDGYPRTLRAETRRRLRFSVPECVNALGMSATRGRRWEVSGAPVTPKVEDIVPDAEVAGAPTRLNSTYYDTVDLDLVGAGVTVRRCDDEGAVCWRVNAPGIGDAIDIHAGDQKDVPKSITRLLRGLTSGKDLVDVAAIHAARYSSQNSKLGYVISGLQAPPIDVRERPLVAYTRTQLDAIIAGDILLRRGEDPIHDTRVAIRRLRSTLRVFRKVSNGSDTRPVEGELKWFAGLLGEVRDCQVQVRRVTRALNELPADLVLGPVRGDVTSHLLGVELPARQRIADAMDSQRYLVLMAVLCRWRTDPPFVGDGDMRALQTGARRASKKADRRLAVAVGGHDDDSLHRARKAAKRARYAAEVMVSVEPKFRRKIKGYKRIQSLLGDHQDTVVARRLFRRLAAAGAERDRNGFTYGLLFERERQLARKCRNKARRLLAS
jgi:CHAD domain-containing protein